MPSGQTETLKNASGTALSTKTLSYTYDSLGNIETISEGGIQRQKYYYDSLNQLIREDNLDLNKTIVYSYDLGGNLTDTEEYAYQTGATVTGSPTTTNTYTYGDSNWKDKLTAYNGNTITYDQIGNPLSYRNGFTFTWQKGRQLASASNGSTSVSYTYNNDGYRTSKTVNGTTTDYTLEGSKVLIEKTGSDYIWYYYDAAGAPVAMATGSDPSLYIYRKNLQGDITGIYSGSTGALLVSYVYDAWGKVTATNVAGTTESATVLARNPYLYRGYRYDAETGLYYLNSRYYDPETGRFINADDVSNIGADDMLLGHNLFTYCLNNPVNRSDDDGEWSLPNWAKILVGVAVIAAAAAITVATAGAASGTVIAAVNCVATGALQGAVTGAVTGAITGAVTGAVEHRITTGTWQGAAQAAYDSSVNGFMMGAITGAVTGAVTSQACFVAGTVVLAELGAVAIESIRAGDKVWAWNEETGEVSIKTVQETYVNKTEELIHLTVNGEEIVTTPTHPFYTPVKGWVKAVDLRAGDILVLMGGEYVIIELVQHEILENPVRVYNLNVEDAHTYYVSANGVLVHNVCTNHGNSLSTDKPAEGYILRSKKNYEILKYGETTRGYSRYTHKFLEEHDAVMQFVAKGTKRQMHEWQCEIISVNLDFL